MVTRQNPESGPSQFWVVLEEDGLPVMLEGRPAIYEQQEHAERARRRCSRPSQCSVSQIVRIEADSGTIYEGIQVSRKAEKIAEMQEQVPPAAGSGEQ